MRPYTLLARFYDPATGDRSEMAAFIRRLIARHHPEARTLFELACGTGEILKLLSPDYDVAGLDRSPQMLAIARRKLPGIPLFRQDMVAFDLDRRFDVILCVYDSINHVLRFSDWKKIFRRAAAHLAGNGLFIFDINTIAKFERLCRTPPVVHRFDGGALTMTVAKIGRGMTNWRIQIERASGRGRRRFEENIKEASFPAATIRAALAKDFARIKVIDPLNSRPSIRSDRLYFICKR
ncbi:MAG TPA: methyltransferase domain-containing protein [Candidatus Acidoferrales bacterium]|nr:methyltransferase domain-containing protein [Candidatus Acidoferrales bacterium]